MKKMDKNSHSSGGLWQKQVRVMKLCFILTFIGIMHLSAATYSQDTRLDLKVKNASLESVMNNIRAQSEYSFFFDDVAVKKISNITLNLQGATIEEVLTTCLKNTGFSFRVLDKTIILFREQVKDDKKQSFIIQGKVVDENNKPMPGVTVLLDSTKVGTATDTAGHFVLPLPQAKGTLVFSFIGYKPQKVKYTDGKLVIVKMQPDVSGLDEVKVVAYGTQKARKVISSISSLKADEMKELPTHSLESLLQGHMAGVEVNNLSGAPGGGGSIVAIRGYNSFFTKGNVGAGDEGEDREYGTPLYVVDGVPMQAFTSPITGSNTLSDLDPSMIESIEVLKDAASAAIYGSRAGNGVILITTKKGRAGKARFTANVSYSASWLPETPTCSGGQLVRQYNMRALRNAIQPYEDANGKWVMPNSYEDVYNYTKDGYYPSYNYFFGNREKGENAYILQDSLNEFYNNSTDWWRYTYRTANVYNANLQASGGSETMSYMIGAGYYKEEGIALGSDFERINVLTNLSSTPTKRLKINNQISLSYSDRSRGGKGAAGNKIEGITVSPMKVSSLLPGNEYVQKYLLEELNASIEKNQSYSLRYNLSLDYEIIRNLRLQVSGSIDYNQQNQNNFSPSTSDAYFHRSFTKGTITKSISLLNENLLTYNFKIKQDHHVDLLFGLSFQKEQSFLNEGDATDGPNDYVHYAAGLWGNGSGLINMNTDSDKDTNPVWQSAFNYKSSLEEQRMNSYFGRLRYDYKEKYLLEATLRRDGSSVFGEDCRWATFPSVAVGWIFTEESFVKPLYWLSFGKIRVSWGQSGQKFSQAYLAHGLMSGSGISFLGNQGMEPSPQGGVLNRTLSWEKTDQYDIGLDLNFLDYRFKLTCDYYYRYTKSQLQQMDMPGNWNYLRFQWQNALAVSNEGLEVELTADIFRETAVKWRMKFNTSRNWNRFEKSNNGRDFLENVIGKSLYNIKAYKTAGYYNSIEEVPYYVQPHGLPMPLRTQFDNAVFFGGTRKLVDLNNDGIINPGDQYYAASPLPVAHGGFINELKWKQFDLNIFFTYSLGRHILKIYDDNAVQPNINGGPITFDIRKINAWTGPDSQNPDYPRAILYKNLGEQYSGLYDCDIEKVNMVRLKQLTLGYNLHERIAKKLGLSGARLFITGENLLLWTNYSGLDPEIVNLTSGRDYLSGYPLPRKFTVGLTVNF
ncbi:SusC/RagA family TonB-linked outer membrane protein [Butyricimonas virosa]|uniref:SusC/RagA family TonB-linked outer membrane protein n=2 Tax=Butyricimonas virosa TaxID=544645 RepID=UPI002432A612|nr:SusC/RagA family TonB-linked outer membrane protein [Butyricimonas virosa]